MCLTHPECLRHEIWNIQYISIVFNSRDSAEKFTLQIYDYLFYLQREKLEENKYPSFILVSMQYSESYIVNK